MSRPTLSVVGAGRAGGSIARALATAGVVTLGQVLNRQPASTADAAARLGARPATPATLEPADWWLFGVPDDALEAAGRAVADAVAPGSLCFHLSGAQPPERLAAAGGRPGAFHPVRPFPVWIEPAELRHTRVGIGGDRAVRQVLAEAARGAGLVPFVVPAAGRATYHAACSMASNFVVTVAAEAERLFRAAGIDPETAAGLAADLAGRAAADVAERGPPRALTGPVVRGDVGTVARQLAAIDPAGQPLYRALLCATLALARDAGRLEPAAAAALEALLSTPRDDPAA